MRTFSNNQNLLLQIRKAALGRQIVLAVKMATSSAGLTGFANLEVAQEVHGTKSI